MIIINTHEAKTKLSELLANIEKTQATVRICRNGVPIADLVPVAKTQNPLKQHAEIKKIKILYDPAAPLDENEWPEDAR
jgi:prevent-host-death family protein